MIDLVIWAIGLLPMDVPPLSPTPGPGGVRPQGSNGFAASIIGAFFGLGIIVLATIFISLKPRRAPPPTRND